MNRKQMIEFCNKHIFPQVNHSQWSGFKGELMEVVKMVSDFRRKNGYPKEMLPVVKNGFLFINNNPVGRIAMKAPKAYKFSYGTAYWEEKILNRQDINESA